MDSILKKAKLDWKDACFMSDDINDLAVLDRVGMPIAVANARREIKKIAKYTTINEGGQGAVREICDKIITAYGRWPAIIEKLKCPDGYREQ